MIQVSLISSTEGSPMELASHAAQECYQAEPPQMSKIINVKDRLFETGHHTTLQHFSFTYNIEGISVGDITFGMHLASPFYNSDQRSGRFCAKMFLEPDFESIKNYISMYWSMRNDFFYEIMVYVRKGVQIFHDNITRATEVAEEFIATERPFAKEKYIEQNAQKFAQEQLRMFIPVIFPTGLDHTVDLSALAALYRSASTPAMRYVVNTMVKLAVEKYPDLSFMFKPEYANAIKPEANIILANDAKPNVCVIPSLELRDIIDMELFKKPDYADMHPIDKLHFKPEYMDNNIGEIRTRIKISTATMGQDQRHRTIRRGKPIFTGDFYLPPIVKAIKLESEALNFQRDWMALARIAPPSLAMILAPYGAMVSYLKVASFNALIHEQAKRLCWCAQEEIYNLSVKLRQSIIKRYGKDCPIISALTPPCFENGKCLEGDRYCGRDINFGRGSENYFPTRRV